MCGRYQLDPGDSDEILQIIRQVQDRRCVFPTTGFFEWGPGEGGKKQKYRFNLPGGDKALYLAGLWNDFAGEPRCVILTTQANACSTEPAERDATGTGTFFCVVSYCDM